jgi:D-sedoheptulose 7-phosphate isomerase
MKDPASRRAVLTEYLREHQATVLGSFEKLEEKLTAVAEVMVQSLEHNHKVLAFGNGGSAAEASHLAGELVGRFSKLPRRPLPAIALSSDPAIVTCIGNDFGYGALFERQLEAFAQPGDVAIAFTTSGTSENVLRGLAIAARKGAATVAFTGGAGLGRGTVDHLLSVPNRSTSFIQEAHLVFLHVLCVLIDKAFIEESETSGIGWEGQG